MKIARLSIDICDLSLKKALSLIYLNIQDVSNEYEQDDTLDMEQSVQESLLFLVSQSTSNKLEIAYNINNTKYFNQSLCCSFTA